jgi:hypothetical protein
MVDTTPVQALYLFAAILASPRAGFIQHPPTSTLLSFYLYILSPIAALPILIAAK